MNKLSEPGFFFSVFLYFREQLKYILYLFIGMGWGMHDKMCRSEDNLIDSLL